MHACDYFPTISTTSKVMCITTYKNEGKKDHDYFVLRKITVFNIEEGNFIRQKAPKAKINCDKIVDSSFKKLMSSIKS